MTEPPPRTPATLDEELLEAESLEVLTTLSDAARLERIHRELEAGFEALAHVGAAVSVFGPARTPPGDPEYELAPEVTRTLGPAGFPILTRGRPGILGAGDPRARARARPPTWTVFRCATGRRQSWRSWRARRTASRAGRRGSATPTPAPSRRAPRRPPGSRPPRSRRALARRPARRGRRSARPTRGR